MKADPPGAGGGMTKAARLRLVIVTLDNHLSGAVERAQRTLAADGISIGFHAAADWEGDPAAIERCREDIARGDIIVATMLFLEDHIRAVLPALAARREQCDAMLGLMSGSEIVRLTRLGGYRMDVPAKGPLALLKKLRGSSKPGADSGAGQMRMLRRLPRLLRYIPGTAQDVRAYFLTLQYWLAGSDDNVVEMARALAGRYAAGPRAAMRERLQARPPVEYPEVGVYHPRMKGRISADAADLPAPVGQPGRAGGAVTGTVGLLLLRSYLLGKDSAHYDGVIAALEARGLKVIPAFASGLDSRPAIEAFFLEGGKPKIDAMVSLTGFSLVGGPAYNDARAAEDLLAGLDIPYVAAHPLEFQTLQQWAAGTQGLLPLEATMMVAIPELDGATSPLVYGGRSDSDGAACSGCNRECHFSASGLVREMQACPERAEALAARVARLVRLRRTPRAERRLAVVLFNFPPNAGSAGSAAFLSVFESLQNTLASLQAAGWTVDLPTDASALKTALLEGNAARFGAEANVFRRVPADEIVRREPHLAEIEAQWGPAPGRVNADGGHAHVMGAQFGNVFVGLQPAIGIEGDPMRLMFEGRYAPTHAMSAFYRHIREDLDAHAVLHFGTHGALEFLPGKQAGLSARCWPERLIGDLPHIYLYASNNPSEGILAKRRTGATLVSYLTPALAEAGLTRGLAELKASWERWRQTPDSDRAELLALMQEQAAALDLTLGDPETLGVKLYELERELIPLGLHVVGAPLSTSEMQSTLDALPEGDRLRAAELLSREHETPALIHALDGGFIRPAPGGDLAKNPEVLPTGRNIHGFDPFALPSVHACREGAAQAERLLMRHVADSGRLPRALAMVLWGTDNLKSEGAQIGQALALMGARPRMDGYGRLCGAELIPLADLGRPRIDVVLTLSGIFRDLLPLQTRMLAEAALLAAQADEPLEQNFVRANSLAHASAHGCDLETAALRVYSNAEGTYGANVNLMIDSGCWTDPDELAKAFETQKGYAYGVKGRPVRQGALMGSALAACELAYQNLESVELGVTTIDQYVDTLGGVARMIRKGRGEAAPVYIGDETQGVAKVRRLEEQVALEVRTRMLNPNWYEPMLRHGGEGVHQIEAGVTATMGWSATTGEVSPWVYQRISETFVLDEAMRDRLAGLNPKAAARVANRLIEASDRKYWAPDSETLEALQRAADALEDVLEGVGARAA
jgi:magnesium chelatase subunit H